MVDTVAMQCHCCPEVQRHHMTLRPAASLPLLSSSRCACCRYYAPDGQQVTVEELALQHYASPAGGGWQGMHTEGGVWRTLFGLLMWDVLFAPVPEVFRTPFQSAPLDLGTDAFYPARREALDERLQQVGSGSWVLGAGVAGQCVLEVPCVGSALGSAAAWGRTGWLRGRQHGAVQGVCAMLTGGATRRPGHT
jgi:hypothetical protein